MFSKSTKLLLGLGLVAVLAGCVQVYEDTKKDEAAAGSTTPATGEPIVIGALLPLSGPGEVYGKPIQWVINYAVKNANDAGGVGGKPLKVEFDDGGCKQEPSTKAVTNLVTVKGVKVIIGGICSSETLAAAPIAEQNKVVVLSPASSDPELTKAGDFIFRNYPSDAQQGKMFADYANKKGWKKVGAFVEIKSYTEGIAEVFEKNYSALGGETVTEKFETEATDMRTQITKVQGAKVDAYLILTQAPAQADVLLKQLQEAGVKGPFLLNDVPMGDSGLVTKYKDYLEGAIGTSVAYDTANPDLAKLKEAYKTTEGKDLPFLYVMAPAYDAVYIVKEAMEKVGEDPVKIKDYLYTVSGRKGLAGTLSFDTNGDAQTAQYIPVILKNGVLEDYKE
ncbi:ABC transporter substrate-binding protein [Candidatus Peregrinibacteria bacterium]|nr:ABC transporter substrate-binding protein [Candidatus Peregrinibacteria bacterium]